LFPDTVEPDVDTRIEILWEDDSLIAVYKPAPLPVHPCGRFYLNTLTSLLQYVYEPAELKLVHRLDANTTGLTLLARNREVATRLRKQFENNCVGKRYLVRCAGNPNEDLFGCSDPIARRRRRAGLRATHKDGDEAMTEFRVMRRHSDQTALLEARPVTGRTNQIRIHLWAMGMPVVGDPAYLKDKQLVAAQTLPLGAPPMCLHASSLSFTHPATGQASKLTAPAPAWVDVGSS
jgi:RluA family pseudouridine synthase